MKVDKKKFDALLSRLIAAEPTKSAEIKSPRPKPKKIVNYGKYRAIKNEDDRREANRIAHVMGLIPM